MFGRSNKSQDTPQGEVPAAQSLPFDSNEPVGTVAEPTASQGSLSTEAAPLSTDAVPAVPWDGAAVTAAAGSPPGADVPATAAPTTVQDQAMAAPAVSTRQSPGPTPARPVRDVQPVMSYPTSMVDSTAETTSPVYEEPTNPGATGAVFGVGFLLLLVGAWAGIVPFVGPIFGYNATGGGKWLWNLTHALLWLAPGAVAVLVGLAMMVRAGRVGAGLSRALPLWGGFLAACCGAWLVIGPLAWRLLEGRYPFRTASPFRELVNQIGYSFGPGALLVLFGGLAMGIVLMSQRAVAPAVARSRVRGHRVRTRENTRTVAA